MLSDELLNQIYIKRQEKIDENIQEEYHKRLKEIKEKNKEERENKKMAIISELYYKQGFRDGINFIANYIQKIWKNFKNNCRNSLQNKH